MDINERLKLVAKIIPLERIIEDCHIVQLVNFVGSDGMEYDAGPCVFCEEKEGDPFCILIAQQIFYCFKCYAGGDVLIFIARFNESTLSEAADFLLTKYADFLLDKCKEEE